MIMLREQISQAQVQALAGEIASALTPVIIQRGWDYYRQGRVYNVVITKEKVQATVQGTYRYLVNISLKDFKLSQCSCPVQVRCKHIAAAFLYLYAIYDWPDQFIKNIDKYASARVNAQESSPGTQQKIGLPESSTIEEWHKYYTREFKRQTSRFPHGPYYYSLALLRCDDFFASIKECSGPWPAPLKVFFEFHATLYAMLQLDKYLHKHDFVYSSGYFAEELTKLQDYYLNRLLESAAKFNTKDMAKKHASYFQQVKTALREILLQEQTPFFNWRFIYRILWSDFFGQQHWVKEEIEQLEEILRQKNLPAGIKYNAVVGLSHFTFLTGNDKKVFELLERVECIEAADFMPYLYSLHEANAIERLLRWLRWLTSRADRKSQPEFRQLCSYWLEMAANTLYQEEAVTALKSLLPESAPFYRKSLLQAGHYKTWVDFHIFKQSFGEMDPKEIRQVESVDVALLLPLYHQYITKLIEQRNRQSYCSAIPLLKTLRNYYKKLKRTGEWQRYINGLTSRYIRLRALQEELRKGKLA